MQTNIEIVETQPVTLAVAEAMVRQSEIPVRIVELFDVVYTWLRSKKLTQSGGNFAVYRFCETPGMKMQAGVPVSGPFASEDAVKCVQLPRMKAAHSKHTGPYDLLHDVHARLNAWCEQQGLARGTLAWEAYGDWVQNPAELVTDVYVELR